MRLLTRLLTSAPLWRSFSSPIYLRFSIDLVTHLISLYWRVIMKNRSAHFAKIKSQFSHCRYLMASSIGRQYQAIKSALWSQRSVCVLSPACLCSCHSTWTANNQTHTQAQNTTQKSRRKSFWAICGLLNCAIADDLIDLRGLLSYFGLKISVGPTIFRSLTESACRRANEGWHRWPWVIFQGHFKWFHCLYLKMQHVQCSKLLQRSDVICEHYYFYVVSYSIGRTVTLVSATY